MKIAFTRRTLAALTPPTSGRVVYSDKGCAGLRLFVTAAGAKTLYYQQRIAGRAEQLRIGPWPEVEIDAARARARALAGEIARGKDPAQERREARAELTIGALHDQFMERHVKPYRKPATQAQYKSVFLLHLAPIKGRRLSALSRRDVQRLHAEIGAGAGQYVANRALALLHAMFERARAWSLFEGENPAAGVERFREQSRERYLQPDELPGFFAALDAEPDQDAREAILFMLWTGARKRNVLAARWEDVNLEAGLWRLPDSKANRPLLLPLAPPAQEVLRARLARSNGEGWLFPSTRSRSGHLEELRPSWDRILERCKLTGLRLHDLRRSLGSWQAAQGSSLTVIGKSLGHASTAATAVYARLDVEPVRASVDRATAAMLAAAKKKQR